MIYYVYAMISILLTGISQTLLKIGTKHNDKTIDIYFNTATMAGYILFLVATLSSILALKGIELKSFYMLTSLNYIIVMILSKIILKEDFNKNKLKSIFLIVAGMIVFNLKT